MGKNDIINIENLIMINFEKKRVDFASVKNMKQYIEIIFI